MCVCKRENVLDTRRRLAIIDGFGMRVKVLQNKIKNLFIKFFSLSLFPVFSFSLVLSLGILTDNVRLFEFIQLLSFS